MNHQNEVKLNLHHREANYMRSDPFEGRVSLVGCADEDVGKSFRMTLVVAHVEFFFRFCWQASLHTGKLRRLAVRYCAI